MEHPISSPSSTAIPHPSIGLILFGGGRWGTHLLRNFLQQPVRIVAIVDPCVDRLNALARQHALDPSVILTTDWDAAMRLPGVDAVAIATPAMTHYPLIRAALQHGYHVLAEKPLTLDIEESLALC